MREVLSLNVFGPLLLLILRERDVYLEGFKYGWDSGENGVIGRRFDGETVLEGRIGHTTSAHVEVGFLMMK